MRFTTLRQSLLLAPFALLVSGSSGATTIYDETIQADLSGDPNTYTKIQVQPGANTLILRTGPAETDVEDFFELVLGGLSILRIEILDFDPGANNPGGTRFGICQGPGDACFPSPFVEVLITPADIGTDLLAVFEAQAPGQVTNFFRAGESTGPSTTTLSIVATPEPSTWVLLGASLPMLSALRRWRGRPPTA